MKRWKLSLQWTINTIWIALLAGVATGVIITFLSGGGASIVNTIAVYTLYCSVLVAGVVGINMQELYFPLYLSFGCSRKYAYRQFQIQKFLVSFGITAVVICLLGIGIFLEEKRLPVRELSLTGIGIFFLLGMIGSIGNIFGAMANRFGKWVIAVIVLSFGILGGVLGYAVGAGAGGEIIELIGNILKISQVFHYMGIGCLVLELLDLWISGRLMRKATVNR